MGKEPSTSMVNGRTGAFLLWKHFPGQNSIAEGGQNGAGVVIFSPRLHRKSRYLLFFHFGEGTPHGITGNVRTILTHRKR